jgi:hypothetical protein
VDDLVVNNQLTAPIVDHQCSNTPPAVCESGIDLAIEPTLVDDSDTLLNITSLGHADDQAIRTHIKNAVLLVDRAEHALDIDAGLRIAHEGALFLKLTSEEIDTQVSVLACLGRRGDADDLAWTPLKDDEIANADELAGDRDGVGWEAAARLDKADLLADTFSHAAWTTFLFFDDHLLSLMTERVRDALSSALEATAEGVVFALVVVVTHVVAAGLVDFDVFLFDSDFFSRSATFVFHVVGGVDAAAVVALSPVELGLEGLVSCLSAVDVDFDFLIVSATAAFDVDVDFGVLVLNWLSVAKGFQSAGTLRWTVSH